MQVVGMRASMIFWWREARGVTTKETEEAK